MKTFLITSLYSFILISVMVFRGCSASVETSRGGNQQLDGASGQTPKPADAPADPADTPPPTEKIPTKFKTDWHKDIAALRDEIAKSDCEESDSPQGARIKKALDLLVCRVKEQNAWFENPLLYKNPDNNHSCVSQTKQLHTNVLKNADKEATADGSSWLADACKAAADQALEDLNTGKRFESSNGKDIPTKAEIKRAFNLVLTKIKESKYADFDADPEAEEETHNIKLMLEYSLNRINHNCAAHMDTDGFLPRKIRSDESQGNAKVSYIYREYYNYPDGGADKIDPVFGRYLHVIHDRAQNLKIYGKPMSSRPFQYLPKSAYAGDKTPTASDLVTISTLDTMAKLRIYFNRVSIDKCTESSLDDCKTDVTSDATVAKTETIVSDDFGSALSHNEKRDIIPIRKIETQCTACDAYKRHQKSTTGETNKADAAQTNFFSHTDFDVIVNTKEVACVDKDGAQKRVVAATEMCEEEEVEEEDIEPLASKFPSCKYYKQTYQSTLAKPAINHIARGIMCHTREAPSGHTLTSFCNDLPNNEKEGEDDEPYIREAYCGKGTSRYAQWHGTCPTYPKNEASWTTKPKPVYRPSELFPKPLSDPNADDGDDDAEKGFCRQYTVTGEDGSRVRNSPLRGHVEIKIWSGEPNPEIPSIKKHLADEYAICHLEGSTKAEMYKNWKAKSSCNMMITYNEEAGLREAARKNLARFIGVKYADLGKCQLEVDTDLDSRDYSQFNLCAAPYTFYSDEGDGERASDSQTPDSKTSFNTAREKFCITQ